MWRLCDNIRDVINTCDGTFFNLSAYLCDWSLGAHKIMHPILSLKLGVTCFDANPPTFRSEGARSCETSPSSLMNCFGTNPTFQGEGARSCETSPSALMNCFDANPPTFRGEGARSCETSPSTLMNCFVATWSYKALSNRCASPGRIFAKSKSLGFFHVIVLRLRVFLTTRKIWAFIRSLCT